MRCATLRACVVPPWFTSALTAATTALGRAEAQIDRSVRFRLRCATAAIAEGVRKASSSLQRPRVLTHTHAYSRVLTQAPSKYLLDRVVEVLTRTHAYSEYLSTSLTVLWKCDLTVSIDAQRSSADGYLTTRTRYVAWCILHVACCTLHAVR